MLIMIEHIKKDVNHLKKVFVLLCSVKLKVEADFDRSSNTCVMLF